ncbi:hypothetical protein U3516DRAFT_753478 [Neocallimastix sp. 'constans']
MLLKRDNNDDKDIPNNDEFKSSMTNQKKIQEGYTDDLIKLKASLKVNSLAFLLAFTDLLK